MSEHVTPEDVDAAIQSEAYAIFHDMFMVCVLRLKNGCCVVGSSAAPSADVFDPEQHRPIAFEDARRQIWTLLEHLAYERAHLKDALRIPGGTKLPANAG